MKTTITLLTVLAIAATVMAVPLQVKVAAPAYYDYQATVISGPVGIYDVGETFRTFCIERHEDTSNGATYNVVLDDKAMDGGVLPAGTGDPLDTKTAFLYSEFINGNLASFGIGNDTTSYTIMQNVIWSLEGDGSVIGLGSGTIGGNLLAYAAANADGSNYDVKVMVMSTATGAKAQDMLVTVPEPATLAILALGGLMLKRKK